MNIPGISLEPLCLDGVRGKLFALFYSAERTIPEHVVVYCPPFLEEMNKSRRMASLLARNLASHGYGVLMLDIFGTGDSEGDCGDATWDAWCDDLSRGIAWARHKGASTLTLWGLRFGALLAANTAASIGEHLNRIVLWNPILSGKTMLNQFLRLQIAAEMTTSENSTSVSQLRKRLAEGMETEIAGYTLNPALTEAVDRQNLVELLEPVEAPIYWFEVVSGKERPWTVPVQRAIEALGQHGKRLVTSKLVGQPFWSSVEIVVVEDLLEKTVEMMSMELA